jgi:hypothetical protein
VAHWLAHWDWQWLTGRSVGSLGDEVTSLSGVMAHGEMWCLAQSSVGSFLGDLSSQFFLTGALIGLEDVVAHW